MADDRPLSLSITHTDANGGTTSVDYSEEKSPHRLGQFMEMSSPEGSGTTRIYYCKWEKRYLFCEALEGFNELHDAAPLGINTKYIRRANPHGYEKGYYDTPATYSGARNWQYCVKTEVIGEREGEKYEAPSGGSVTYQPWYKYAVVRATYAALDYDLAEDSTVYEVLGSGGSYRAKEWQRNCRILYKQGGKYTVDRSNYLKWATDPPESPLQTVSPDNAVGSGFGVARWEPFADLVVQWLDVPFIPLLAMRRCQGKVNQELFLDGHPDYLGGFDPETMLFLGGEPVRNTTRLNRKTYNITYYFREVHIRPTGTDTDPYGHNHLPRLIENQTKRKYQRVSYDGLTALTTGTPFIDVEEFDLLFKAP